MPTLVTLSLLASIFGFALVNTMAAALDGTPVHYIVGLEPDEDNWLALRTFPTTLKGDRIAKLDPRTLLRATGSKSGRWLEVEVVTTENAGLRGWVYGRYTKCCINVSASSSFHFVKPEISLSLRDGPSSTSTRVRVLNGGTLLEVRGRPVPDNDREWLPVQIITTDARGQKGWASSRFIECCVIRALERTAQRMRGVGSLADLRVPMSSPVSPTEPVVFFRGPEPRSEAIRSPSFSAFGREEVANSRSGGTSGRFTGNFAGGWLISWMSDTRID